MIKSCPRNNNVWAAGGFLCLALMLTSLTGCKSKEAFGLNMERVDETRALIQAEIPDADRANNMLAVVDSYEAEAKVLVNEVKAKRSEIVEANRDYDTTREELQNLYDQLGKSLAQLAESAKQHSLKLRSHCSEEEWGEIFDDEDRLINFKY